LTGKGFKDFHTSNVSAGNMLHVCYGLSKPALGYRLEKEIFLFIQVSRPALGQIQSPFHEYWELFALG
jgi:hypothetical protein